MGKGDGGACLQPSRQVARRAVLTALVRLVGHGQIWPRTNGDHGYATGPNCGGPQSHVFAEKDTEKAWIDYAAAVGGCIQLVPEGGALESLEQDYLAMLDDGLLASGELSFAEIIGICTDLQKQINAQNRS